MSGTTMIVIIVFLGIAYDMYSRHLKFKERTMKHNQVNDETIEKMAQEIKVLQERIQVLEAIVTDEGYQVKKEINQL